MCGVSSRSVAAGFFSLSVSSFSRVARVGGSVISWSFRSVMVVSEPTFVDEGDIFGFGGRLLFCFVKGKLINTVEC
jgi:hypothetical protein